MGAEGQSIVRPVRIHGRGRLPEPVTLRHSLPMNGAPAKPTVLVVDDDDGARASMARVLDRSGYVVRTAADPREALRLARTGDVDLAVVDVFLPLMSGLALAHSLSRANRNLRILYVSGFAREEAVKDATSLDARVDFLEKPFEPRQLEEAVARLLASE